MEVGAHEAETMFSELLRRVLAGEEVVITRSGEPIAKLVPLALRRARKLGVDVGRFSVPDDFDSALPDDALDERGWRGLLPDGPGTRP